MKKEELKEEIEVLKKIRRNIDDEVIKLYLFIKSKEQKLEQEKEK